MYHVLYQAFMSILFLWVGDLDHSDALLTPDIYYDSVLCIMYYILYLCLFHSDGWVK